METKILAKEEVLDRIEQSFELLKNNFIELFLPIFLYTFGTITILISILSYLGMKFIQNFFKDIEKTTQNLDWLNYSSEIAIGITVFIILIILYLTIYIPFGLATIKGIKQAYSGDKITTKENIVYGFKNIFNSFKTYWYVFAYVTLIPGLILIIGGFLAIYGMQFGNENFTQIGTIISIFALIFFVFFSIYRGTKSNFYMASAIDKNEFTKQNFNFSIKVTKNQFRRIIGNFLLIGIIINLISGLFNQIIGLFGSSFDFNIESLMNLKEHHSKKEISDLINQTVQSYSPLMNLFINTLENVIKTISTVFVLIFTYMFFKRLEIENNPEIIKEEIIEL